MLTQHRWAYELERVTGQGGGHHMEPTAKCPDQGEPHLIGGCRLWSGLERSGNRQTSLPKTRNMRTTKANRKREVLSRAAQTMAALARLKIIWKDKNIRIKHKIRLMRALVMTIFLYACETWTLTAELQRRIQALEFRCFRKILGISYKDRVTNEHVRETIVKHIGPYEDLLATVKRRKLKWYGHVTRSDGLSKVILQGTVEGSRRRGRPKKSWSDNIAEWTGKSFAETQAMAHNRQEWRELTRKSIMTRTYGSSRS